MIKLKYHEPGSKNPGFFYALKTDFIYETILHYIYRPKSSKERRNQNDI